MQNSRPNRRSSGRPRPQKRVNKPSTIPHERFINKAVAPADETPYVPTHSFHDFALSTRTLGTLDHIGYSSPSPIQDQTIAPGLEGRDIIGLANTGTGKTAAFLLPILEKLAKNPTPSSALVLAPTRELAQQINDEFRRFAAGQRLYSTLIVGGANINRQINEIKRGPQLIIGTPGRVNDLIDRRVLRLSNCTTFVLDEADRMCDMGFVGDIRRIAAELPAHRQTFCFSATMTPDVQAIVESFMNDPITVSVIKNQTNDHIEQDVIHAIDRAHKIELLTTWLQDNPDEKVVVFCETKHFAQRLSDTLAHSNIRSVAIHGNKSQGQRERALRDFKTGTARVLVATDVAARGLDIPDVSTVINFDAPKRYEDYVHRIGRTGRAGKRGQALTFVAKPGSSSRERADAPRAARPPRRDDRSRSPSSDQSPRPKRSSRRSPGAAAEHRLVQLIDNL